LISSPIQISTSIGVDQYIRASLVECAPANLRSKTPKRKMPLTMLLFSLRAADVTRNYDRGRSRRDFSPMLDSSDSFSLSRRASFWPRLASCSMCSCSTCPEGSCWDCFSFWPVRLVVIGFYSVRVLHCVDNASAPSKVRRGCTQMQCINLGAGGTRSSRMAAATPAIVADSAQVPLSLPNSTEGSSLPSGSPRSRGNLETKAAHRSGRAK